MNKLKLPKFHWAKLLSIFFFILLLGAYANIFAIGIYNPGETLDPTCTPGSLDCTVNLNTIETDPITGAINGLVKADGAGNISAVTSGTDIKTINGSSILGSGDILVSSSPITVVNGSNLFSTGLTGTGSGVTSTSRSIFLGPWAGDYATNAYNSIFLGQYTGHYAANASSSIFLGTETGYLAVNAVNSIFIGQKSGYFDGVDNTTNGLSSIIIGSFASTGGYSNSIILGSGVNGGYISNTKANQFMLAPTVTEMRLRGVDYTLPASQGGASTVLTNNGSGVLTWGTVAGGLLSDADFNTTGYQNSSYGYASLYSNTTGITNSTLGVYSLRFSITGNNNTAVGYNSGTYIANGSTHNTTSDYSVYLGADTKALTDDGQNEIVIGYNAIGNGSNTATIGDTSLLRTYLTGINLKAGSATAGTAPLKLTSGTNLSSTEAGAIEYDGSHLYFTATDGGTRYQLDQQGISSQWDNVTGGINYADGYVGIGTTNPTSNLEIRLSTNTLYNQTFLGVGLDDATYSGTYTGTGTSDYIYVNIDGEGSPDSFSYFNDGGDCFGNGVSITGSAQLICNGISITFSSTTGHTNGDEWDYSISVTPTPITDPVFTIGNGFNNYFVVNAVAPDSIFIGNNAGHQAISALESIFIGNNSGYQATNSTYSNFIGYRSGYQATSSYNSNFIGTSAGEGAIDAIRSNFIGASAGLQASSAHNSNFIGSGAGYQASSAYNSNFLGEGSGHSATNARHSNFMGFEAGQSATNAAYSNFMGDRAGYQATNAGGSNFFGFLSGYQATGANESNFIGEGSGSGASSASYSNFFGIGGGSNALNAANSIFIGSWAGRNDTVNNTASYNETTTFANTSILIGHRTNTGSFSNSIALGAYAINTASNQFMIGSTTRPIDTTRINGTASTQCTITTGVGIACTSDERLKNITSDLAFDTLDKLIQVRAVNFNWKEGDTETNNIGFLAQDLENYFPEVVSTDADGYKSVYYANMTPILTEAIRELDLKVKNLDEKINGVTLSDMMGEFFGGVVVSVSDGIAYMKGIVVDTLKVGSPEKRTGITLYDELTGDPYCLSISGGVTKTIEGECGIITPVEPMEEEIVEEETAGEEEEAETNIEPPAEETTPDDSIVIYEIENIITNDDNSLEIIEEIGGESEQTIPADSTETGSTSEITPIPTDGSSIVAD